MSPSWTLHRSRLVYHLLKSGEIPKMSCIPQRPCKPIVCSVSLWTLCIAHMVLGGKVNGCKHVNAHAPCYAIREKAFISSLMVVLYLIPVPVANLLPCNKLVYTKEKSRVKLNPRPDSTGNEDGMPTETVFLKSKDMGPASQVQA